MIRQKTTAPPCACHRPRLAGYLDTSGNYQSGTNPDPTYGGTVTAPDYLPQDAIGQPFSDPYAPGGSLNPAAASTHDWTQRDWTQIVVIALLGLVALDAGGALVDRFSGSKKKKR
jgi:hypothetical protein